MKKHIKLNGVLILIVFTLLFIPTTYAIEYGGVGLIPANPDPNNNRTQSIFVETLKPLESKTNEILVVNNSSVTKTLLIYAVDSQKASDGAFACAQYSDPKKNVGNWIELKESEVTLEPSTNKKVAFTITVPENIGVGEENGCIIVQEKESNLSQLAGATLSFRTGVRVAVTIPGQQIRNIGLEKFDIDTKGLEPKLLTIIEAKNSGNTSVDTDITLYQGDKELVKNTYPILRGDTATYNIELDKPYWGGFIEYTTEISYDKSATTLGIDSGQEKEVIKKTIQVFVFPQPQAIFVIVGIFGLVVIVLFLSVRLLLRYRYRRLWTEEYIVGEGEDLESISEKLGLPWKIMARVNRIKPPYAVEPGHKIKVFPQHLTHPQSLVEPRINIVPIQPQLNVTPMPSIENVAFNLCSDLENNNIMREYTAKDGDNIDNVSKKLGLDWKILAEFNNIQPPYTLVVGQVLQIPEVDIVVKDNYVVKDGDTILTIAEIFGVDWKTLAKYNDIDAPYILNIGQVLTKPKKLPVKSKKTSNKK
jgi:LysM repeat protein